MSLPKIALGQGDGVDKENRLLDPSVPKLDVRNNDQHDSAGMRFRLRNVPQTNDPVDFGTLALFGACCRSRCKYQIIDAHNPRHLSKDQSPIWHLVSCQHSKSATATMRGKSSSAGLIISSGTAPVSTFTSRRPGPLQPSASVQYASVQASNARRYSI
jgi:hypothetical protein